MVSDALLQAFVLIVLVLALFLLNLRAVILVLLSIPLSIGMALTLMSYYGVSANLMSLGGLAVAIGMMVDGSVVMIENIFKKLSDVDHDLTIEQRIALAIKAVAKPVFFAVTVIMVVFAPLFTLQGVEGKLFKPMAISILLAMGASLLVALVVIPALSSLAFAKGVTLRQNKLVGILGVWLSRVVEAGVGASTLCGCFGAVVFVGGIGIDPKAWHGVRAGAGRGHHQFAGDSGPFFELANSFGCCTQARTDAAGISRGGLCFEPHRQARAWRRSGAGQQYRDLYRSKTAALVAKCRLPTGAATTDA